MKWITISSEKDLPKDPIKDVVFKAMRGNKSSIDMGDREAIHCFFKTGYTIEWLDESINQEGSLKDSDWKDMWYSNSKRTKVHSEIEEDIEWIEQNVAVPLKETNKEILGRWVATLDENKALQNKIKELENVIAPLLQNKTSNSEATILSAPEILKNIANKYSYESWGDAMYDTHEHTQIQYTVEAMEEYKNQFKIGGGEL